MLILLLLYCLVKVKFTVEIRLEIYFLKKNLEMQLGVQRFLKEISYTTPFLFSKLNKFTNRLKHKSVLSKIKQT